jgi:uncharacterized membrane protein
LQDHNDESSRDGNQQLPTQLYTKDAAGNFVPVAVEPVNELSEDGEESGLLLAMQRRSHIGPLPPADTFRDYGAVLPTAPERIMCMAEKEQAAAHEARRTHQRDERYLVSQGQWMGFLSMTLALGGGIYVATLGYVVFACALVSPAVITPIMRFYFKGRSDAAQRERESEDDNPS